MPGSVDLGMVTAWSPAVYRYADGMAGPSPTTYTHLHPYINYFTHNSITYNHNKLLHIPPSLNQFNNTHHQSTKTNLLTHLIKINQSNINVRP